MTASAYALIGLTAIVAALIGVLMFAVLRFAAAARDSKRFLGENQTEAAFVTAALHEALTKVKAGEREMSARAEASERLSEEIVESLTSGLLVAGSQGQLRIVNPAGRRMLNLPASAVNRNYRDALSKIAPLARVIEECFNSGLPIVRRKLEIGAGDGPADHLRQGYGGPPKLYAKAEAGHNVQTAKAGHHVLPAGEHTPAYLGVSVSPLSNGRGQPHGVICLFTDLTPVVEMEEQLRLKESLAEVGELTAGIAHEFRNGLATIHGYARLVDLKALPEVFRPHVEGIRQETEALGEVVTNFLNFARPAQMSLSPVDLRAVAERAAEEVRNEARAHGGDVEIRGEFGVIEGDDVLLRQALSNLLRNAVEACVGASVPPRVSVEGRLDGEHVRVSINDNGPGIDPAIRERIFRPFFTTKGRGTGLGLALVQKIVVIHNGRIQVTTSATGGASFQALLPIATTPS